MPPHTFAFDRRAGFVDFHRENGFLVINGVYSKDDIVALTKTCDELSARRRADGKNPQNRRYILRALKILHKESLNRLFNVRTKRTPAS